MSRKHIFISYRSLELDQALQIAEGLAQHGFPVWMDRLDGILPGDNWRDKLQEAVNNSFAMVSMISRNYVESEWCKREYQLADSLKVPIFPARIGEVETSKMPIEINSIQYVDFLRYTTLSSDTEHHLFFDVLRRLHATEQPYTLVSDMHGMQGLHGFSAIHFLSCYHIVAAHHVTPTSPHRSWR